VGLVWLILRAGRRQGDERRYCQTSDCHRDASHQRMLTPEHAGLL
jgi:hypothetical protein